MNIKAKIATALIGGLAIVGLPAVAAPAMNASGIETPGVTAEAYYLGWGPVCRTDRFRVASGYHYITYRNVEYRWFNSGLTGTKCIHYRSWNTTIRW